MTSVPWRWNFYISPVVSYCMPAALGMCDLRERTLGTPERPWRIWQMESVCWEHAQLLGQQVLPWRSILRDFHGIQWLRHCNSNAGFTCWIPCGGNKISHAERHGQKIFFVCFKVSSSSSLYSTCGFLIIIQIHIQVYILLSFHTNYLIFWCFMHFKFTMLCFLPFAVYDLSTFIKNIIISCSSQYVRLFHHFSLSLTGLSQLIINWYHFPSKICLLFTMTIISIHHCLSPSFLQ